MNILLDTHTFLWMIDDHSRLSSTARNVLIDGDNKLYLSSASAWEIAIKQRMGKLRLSSSPETFIPDQLIRNTIESLPIHVSHALRTSGLPDIHRDPVDRILVAQAQLEHLVILTADGIIPRYDVDVIW